jgi:hypothetical protein
MSGFLPMPVSLLNFVLPGPSHAVVEWVDLVAVDSVFMSVVTLEMRKGMRVA